MQYVLDKLGQIRNKLQGKYLFLFLDYDGTLAPIASTPDKAVFPEETKAILKQLSQKPGCRVAVISGRQLSDIKKNIGLKDIIYSGNHGLEIQGPQLKYRAAVLPEYIKIIGQIKNSLDAGLAKIKGVIIENKGISLCLHYRLVKKDEVPLVKTIFHEIIIDYLVKGIIAIKPGKMAIDIRPSSWIDKGKAVLWLLAREDFRRGSHSLLPIYIGDDLTDEDAFLVLKDIGLTMCVGKNKGSHAQYYFQDTGEVVQFLRMVLEVLDKGDK